MRIKRYKKFQRILNFYAQNFGLEQPYHIFVDGTFANAALENKVSIQDQLCKCLNGSVRIVTSACVLREVEKLGPALTGALQILQNFQKRDCCHASGKTASKCILSTVKAESNQKCLVATQDQTLRVSLREIPGIPLIYLHGNTPTLEHPSFRSQMEAQKSTGERLGLPSHQKTALIAMKTTTSEDPDSKRHGTAKRKRLGPNPLSCKKRKGQSHNKNSSDCDEVCQKKKRKRVKLRIPRHVKESVKTSSGSI